MWVPALGVAVALRNPSWSIPVLACSVMILIPAAAGVIRPSARWWPEVFFVSLLSSVAVDLYTMTDAIASAAVCMSFPIVAAPAFVLPLRRALPMIGAGTVIAASCAAAGGAEARLVGGLLIIAVCYTAAVVAVVVVLRQSASLADRQASIADTEDARLVAARVAAHTRADYSRTMHDTVVNTLTVVASGGAAVADHELVRRRCAADLATIADLTEPTSPGLSRLDDVVASSQLPIVWVGMDAPSRRQLESELTDTQVRALERIVRELLRNVEQHADADRVTIEARRHGDFFEVVVTDDGRGFSPETTQGFGLAESVHRRAAEAGLEVDVSSTPGSGTRASVSCPLSTGATVGRDVASARHADRSGDDVARSLGYAGAWAWAAAIGFAGLILAVGGGAGIHGIGSSIVVLGLSAVCYILCRDGRRLTPGWAIVVAAVVPVAFALGFVGIDRGGDPNLWPGIGISPLLVILLMAAPSRWYLVAATGALVVTGALCAELWASTSDLAVIAIVNVVLHLAQMAGWVNFAIALVHVSERVSGARRRARESRSHRVSLAEARAVHERWLSEGVQAALDLLEELQEGRSDPMAPAVQQRAAQVTRELRQRLLLSPDLTHLGSWLAAAVDRSKRRGVHLELRLGDKDLPDAHHAAAVGGALLEAIDVLAPGSEVTVAYFGSGQESDLTIVGPTGFAAALDEAELATVEVRCTTVRDQDLVEFRRRVSV